MPAELTVQELHSRLASAPEDFHLLDCRELPELALARLEPSKHVPMHDIPARIGELDPANTWAVICHHGIRSQHVGVFLEQQGFHSVFNVSGGLDAYARDVDHSMPRY